jgi:hypothetical protein
MIIAMAMVRQTYVGECDGKVEGVDMSDPFGRDMRQRIVPKRNYREMPRLLK